LEAARFESGRDGVEGIHGESAGQFGTGDFNAGQVAVVAHTEFAESQLAETFFRLLDLVKDFACDGAAVFDARGQAGGGGAIPKGVAGGFGEGADLDLGEASVGERSKNGVLLGGALAGAEVFGVVGVHAIGDGGESELGCEGAHYGEEFVLAMEAAICVIAGVFGAVKLVGIDDPERHVKGEGEGGGLFHVSTGEAGRIGKDGEHFGAEDAVRGGREIGGVDAAGVGDHEAADLGQARFKSLQLGSCRNGGGFGNGCGGVRGRRHRGDYTFLAVRCGLRVMLGEPFKVGPESWLIVLTVEETRRNRGEGVVIPITATVCGEA